MCRQLQAERRHVLPRNTSGKEMRRMFEFFSLRDCLFAKEIVHEEVVV